MPNECRSIDDYKLLLESSPMMIWMANTEQKFDYFNRKWRDFRGNGPGDDNGKVWLSAIYAEDRKLFIDMFLDAFERRECFESEFRLLDRDGTYRWVYCSGAPVEDSIGSFAGFIGTCMDINGHIQRERVFERLLAEIKQDGVIPICSSCNKVRDRHGNWHTLEEVLQNPGALEFSHTVCPDCEKQLYGK
jgi:PAS domain S-box-containing protein